VIPFSQLLFLIPLRIHGLCTCIAANGSIGGGLSKRDSISHISTPHAPKCFAFELPNMTSRKRGPIVHFRTVLDSLACYKSYSKCRPVPSVKKKLAAVPTR
jgi:hypothetical protein